MNSLRRVWCASLVILLHACIAPHISSFPHNASNDDMEIITVEEIEHFASIAKNLTATLITQSKELNEQDTNEQLRGGHDSNANANSNFNVRAVADSQAQNDASNEPAIDTADDLIFLAERPQQQHNEQKLQQPTPGSVGTSAQIDLLTSAEEDSLTAISTAASASEHDNVSKADSTVSGVTTPQIELRIRHVSADNSEKDDDDDDNDDVDSISADDDEADASTDNDEEHDVASVEVSVAPIDMSDFVALIPAVDVKSIASNYYRNDPEVQRAYAYLSSRDFTVLRQHIIELPEVRAFLRYLNNSGLDVVGFLNTLTNLTCKPEELTTEETTTDDVGSGSEAVIGNEIEVGRSKSSQSSTTTTMTTTTSAESATTPPTTEEQLNGLHGLVDSILDILPQDQILATFFDKLESSEQFSKLVDNIGQPAFARILHNMQNSTELRKLVFTLHNNGIYITRIVDSLKAYFFLGTF